jgi:hypothetical protein
LLAADVMRRQIRPTFRLRCVPPDAQSRLPLIAGGSKHRSEPLTVMQPARPPHSRPIDPTVPYGVWPVEAAEPEESEPEPAAETIDWANRADCAEREPEPRRHGDLSEWVFWIVALLTLYGLATLAYDVFAYDGAVCPSSMSNADCRDFVGDGG